MKTFLKVIGVLVIVIIAVVALALTVTSGLPKAADAFFSQIAAGKIEAAYYSTAAEFQASSPLPAFRGFLETSSLGQYESASWSERSVENDVGNLKGTVNTRGGGKIPVAIKLIKENDIWKILGIEKTQGGIAETASQTTASQTETTQTSAATIPPGEELIRLAGEAIDQFALAVKQDNFDKLYQNISEIWRKQISAVELRNAYLPFVEHKTDLTTATKQPPTFTESTTIDQDGVLTLQGFYPVDPYKLQFRLKFVKENNQWKLLGLALSM